ncbi:MAG: alpha-amylase family glycosyl hydrolase, partial [Thermomicrobiales bacterium]
HMGFHFPVMPRIFLSVKREEPSAILEIMRATPDKPPDAQWCVFLRNHDELTLEMVTEDERQELWADYASEPRMRCNLGIRRRLAPLVDNDPAVLRLLNSLMFSLPGSPIIYYGDELGMGDNIWLYDRNGVRTPMQWNAEPNAGFSFAGWGGLYAPIISDPIYGFQHINVEEQTNNPTSLLNWVKSLLALRREHRAF